MQKEDTGWKSFDQKERKKQTKQKMSCRAEILITSAFTSNLPVKDLTNKQVLNIHILRRSDWLKHRNTKTQLNL